MTRNKEGYVTETALYSFAAVGNRVMLLQPVKQLIFPAGLHTPSWMDGEGHQIHFLSEKMYKKEDLSDTFWESQKH